MPPILNYRERMINGYLFVDVLGGIFGGLAKQFENYLLEKIVQGQQKVVLNFSRVELIDSAAWGVVVGLWKTVMTNNGSFNIISNSMVMEKASVINLQKVIHFFSSEQEFLAKELHLSPAL